MASSAAPDRPLNARQCAVRLGVANSTLNAWLAADENRPLAERRFNFHRNHGRKRLWSEEAFQALKLAIETESEPGGCLAGWRVKPRGCNVSAREAQAATAALHRVLNFRIGADADEVPAGGTADDDEVDHAQTEIR